MRKAIARLGLVVLVIALFMGNPRAGFLLPPAVYAQPPMDIICSSVGYNYSRCDVYTGGGVRIIEQLSRSRCDYGRTWGVDGRGIWVDNGCAGRFIVGRERRDRNGNDDVVGAAIIGGVIGAILSHDSDRDRDRGRHDDRNNNYYGRPRYRHSDYVDPTPQFDKDGNPNFDTHGRYIGPHGLGSLVDNPDVPQN